MESKNMESNKLESNKMESKKISEEIRDLMEEKLVGNLWERYEDEITESPEYDKNYDRVTNNSQIDWFDTKYAKKLLRKFWKQDIDNFEQVMKKLGIKIDKKEIIRKGEECSNRW